ncbi:hypothetical protein [Pantoea wallisii]|nr:hypothetical protein [Pantoea wallisii]
MKKLIKVASVVAIMTMLSGCIIDRGHGGGWGHGHDRGWHHGHGGWHHR